MDHLLIEILIKARDLGATNINIESASKGSSIRFRIDSTLHEIMSIEPNEHQSILNTIRTFSQLQSSDMRIFQDGLFELNSPALSGQYSVSVFPGLLGNRISISPYGRKNFNFGLDSLGLSPDILNVWCEQIQSNKPSLFVVSGPTNSGKNTTVYSALLEVRKKNLTVATAEYEPRGTLPGVHQVVANDELGMDFAAITRGLLYNDVDAIYVREFLDYATAEIALKAVLNKNKIVFTAMHCNDTIHTLQRFIWMGLEPWMIAEGVSIIQGQRLLRTLCQHCKVGKRVPNKVLTDAGMDPSLARNATVYGPNGCYHCNNLGYRGRTLVTETFRMTDDFAYEMLKVGDRANVLKKFAIEGGLKTLRQDALEKMLDGVTSLEDVLMATDLD